MEIPCSSRVCARNILEDNFSDNSKSNKSNMHFYLSLTLLLAAFVARKVEGSNSNQTADKMVKQPGVVERFNPSYNRWDNDAAENELDNSRIRSSHRSQQEYSCGRAVSQQKYKDTLRDQNYHMAMTRPKYRPIEIRMPRVIGGDETVPGEFPWTVSVKLNGQPICGGSLIERNWILTAAHCVVGYNPKNLTIRLGAYRIKDSSETQTVDLEVSMFVVHKDYSMPRPFSNDIALLKLSEPVEFTDFIIPICLPKEDQATPSGVVNEDYMNKIDSNKEEESSGIVFSTKMSDSDIADCFNKLEQNYLNSIGLGTSAESTTERNIQETPPATNRPITNRPISYSNTVDPAIFMSTNNKNKITFMSSQNPGQSFELPFSLDTSSMDAYAPNGYILYGLPWNRKEIGGKDGRKDAFKLSRLPINKELLKEIQSIGSGPMPSLNLGLQQEFASVPDNIVLGNSHSSIVKPANLESIRTPFQSLHDQVDTPSEYSGLKGIVVGWGWIREHDGEDQMNNKGYPSVTLQKVELPILRNNVCEAWFQSQAKKITLLPSQFCAGFNSGGKDACRGDSGGPMIIEDNADSGRYKLIGIVSAGIGCARPSLPGLYTKVASFIPWINAQITRY